jgi:integrase
MHERMRITQSFQPIVALDRALDSAFRRAGVADVSSHNLRKTFATRLMSRGAAITDVQHLLGHATVKTTEKAYAAFVKNERFKQTIELLDKPMACSQTLCVIGFDLLFIAN